MKNKDVTMGTIQELCDLTDRLWRNIQALYIHTQSHTRKVAAAVVWTGAVITPVFSLCVWVIHVPTGEQSSHFINNLRLTARTLTRFTASASSKISQRFSDLQREFNPGVTLSCHAGLLFRNPSAPKSSRCNFMALTAFLHNIIGWIMLLTFLLIC